MRLLRTLVPLAAAALAAACDVPLAPKWDADWHLPLSTQSIHLNTTFPIPIPAGASGLASFAPVSQALDASVGQILDKVVTDPTRSHSVLTLVVSKTTPVALQDTLLVANGTGGLNASTPGTIVFPVSLAAGDLTKADSIVVTPASISMLQNANTVWIQVRGRVSNPGSSPVPITAADSISIRASMTLRIAVSGCPAALNPDKTCP